MNPGTRNIAPAIQIGTDVFKLVYDVMMGAYTTIKSVSISDTESIRSFLVSRATKSFNIMIPNTRFPNTN